MRKDTESDEDSDIDSDSDDDDSDSHSDGSDSNDNDSDDIDSDTKDNRGRRYTKKEIKILMTMMDRGKSHEVIAKRVHRSERSIYLQRLKIRKQRYVSQRIPLGDHVR